MSDRRCFEKNVESLKPKCRTFSCVMVMGPNRARRGSSRWRRSAPRPWSDVQRMTGMWRIRGGCKRWPEPELGFRGIHDRHEPVPIRLELVLDEELHPDRILKRGVEDPGRCQRWRALILWRSNISFIPCIRDTFLPHSFCFKYFSEVSKIFATNFGISFTQKNHLYVDLVP